MLPSRTRGQLLSLLVCCKSFDIVILSVAVTYKNRGVEPKRLEEDLLTNFRINVIGNIHLFNLFTPLVLNGQAKKVIYISSGMADNDLISKFSVHEGATYSISKAAGNTAVAKFDAQYREKGVLFMSISPGVVDTAGAANCKSLSNLLYWPDANCIIVNVGERAAQQGAEMGAKFKAYAPDWNGPLTPQESVKAVLSVVNKASIEAGNGGSFVSHYGNKNWL